LNSFLKLAVPFAAVGLAALLVSAPAMADHKHQRNKIVIHPGDSIQDTVDAAPAGTDIILTPGTYMETHGGDVAVRIKTDDIRLIGRPLRKSKVVLVPGPGNHHGILVEPDDGAPDIQGSRIQGLTVQGFSNNGIKLERVNGFEILNNVSIDNLENGIQPELSANGLVKNNLAYGSNDSALWIEGGTNVRVIGNVTHSSVTGLEVTISKNLVIAGNESYNNTIGMGLYHPSGASEPPLADMGDLQVQYNYIHDNNLPNHAPGGQAASLPPGGGILLNGISDNVLKRNLITNNNFFGLAVVGYCLGQGEFPGEEPPYCPSNRSGVDPVPRNNVIEANIVINNGSDGGDHPLASFAADIIEGYVNLPYGSDPTAGNCFEVYVC
jgi:hypothetical protein